MHQHPFRQVQHTHCVHMSAQAGGIDETGWPAKHSCRSLHACHAWVVSACLHPAMYSGWQKTVRMLSGTHACAGLICAGCGCACMLGLGTAECLIVCAIYRPTLQRCMTASCMHDMCPAGLTARNAPLLSQPTQSHSHAPFSTLPPFSTPCSTPSCTPACTTTRLLPLPARPEALHPLDAPAHTRLRGTPRCPDPASLPLGAHQAAAPAGQGHRQAAHPAPGRTQAAAAGARGTAGAAGRCGGQVGAQARGPAGRQWQPLCDGVV